MIQRRQFLGSIAAVCAVSGSVRHAFASTTSKDTLNWQSRIIETHPHGRNGRAPVVTSVSIQKTGNLLAIVGDNHYVGIYDMAKEKYVHHLDRHADWVRAAKFSPDGSLLATAGNDRKLLIWNTADWAAPTMIKNHPEAIIDVAFNSDGSKIATVGFGPKLRLYDTLSGELEKALNCPCNDMHAVAFSRNDTYLAVGGRSGSIRVWTPSDDSQIAQYKAHRQRIRSIEFTPQDEILSCGDDQIVRIANPLRLTENRALPRHASKLYDVVMLGNGLVATSGSDNQIHVWRIQDAYQVGSLKGHTGTVSCLDVSGFTLVSGSYDTHVRVWTMERQADRNVNPRNEFSNSGWNRKLK